MSDSLGPLHRPIITGRPAATPAQTTQHKGNIAEGGGQSFQELLRQSMATQTVTQPLTLSKHAAARAEQRDITLSDADLQKLDAAVDLAKDKGLTDTLVLMNDTAFIVNVPNRVVITMVGSGETDQTVVTNIDGAVIV